MKYLLAGLLLLFLSGATARAQDLNDEFTVGPWSGAALYYKDAQLLVGCIATLEPREGPALQIQMSGEYQLLISLLGKDWHWQEEQPFNVFVAIDDHAEIYDGHAALEDWVFVPVSSAETFHWLKQGKTVRIVFAGEEYSYALSDMKPLMDRLVACVEKYSQADQPAFLTQAPEPVRPSPSQQALIDFVDHVFPRASIDDYVTTAENPDDPDKNYWISWRTTHLRGQVFDSSSGRTVQELIDFTIKDDTERCADQAVKTEILPKVGQVPDEVGLVHSHCDGAEGFDSYYAMIPQPDGHVYVFIADDEQPDDPRWVRGFSQNARDVHRNVLTAYFAANDQESTRVMKLLAAWMFDEAGIRDYRFTAGFAEESDQRGDVVWKRGDLFGFISGGEGDGLAEAKAITASYAKRCPSKYRHDDIPVSTKYRKKMTRFKTSCAGNITYYIIFNDRGGRFFIWRTINLEGRFTAAAEQMDTLMATTIERLFLQ